MDIKIRKAAPLETKTACLVIGVYEKGFSDPLLKELDQKLGGWEEGVSMATGR